MLTRGTKGIFRVLAVVAVLAAVVATARAAVRLGRTGLFKDRGEKVTRDVRAIPVPPVPPTSGALRLSIAVPSGTIWLGQCVTVTLIAANGGGSRLTGVKGRLAADDSGAVVSAMSGPVPPGPVAIEPGAACSFVWTCTMSGAGIVCFTGTVTGLDSLTEAPFSLSASATTVTKRPATLQAWLQASAAPPAFGSLIDLTVSVSNTGGCDATGVTGTISFTDGGGLMVPMSGPAPAGPVTVGPGALQTFVWSYSVAGIGYVAASGDAKGTDSGLLVPVSASGATEFTSFGGISTIAGPGGLNLPSGVAVDGTGNVYVADYTGHRVWVVDPGTLSVTPVAGDGNSGYTGEGPATTVCLSFPTGVAIGSDGNLYIADSNNHRIRKVDLISGIMTTVAGNGTPAYNGDAMAPTSAMLNNPYGLCFDPAGNLYVADTYNNRVRVFNISGGNIATFAGGGGQNYISTPRTPTAAILVQPYAVAYEAGSGAVYICDTGQHAIGRVSGGLIERVAGTGSAGNGGEGGLATGTALNGPYGICVDSSGNVYVADHNNNKVRMFLAAGTMRTVAGTGTFGYNGDGISGKAAQLAMPWGVAADPGGFVYIGDWQNNRVRKLYP